MARKRNPAQHARNLTVTDPPSILTRLSAQFPELSGRTVSEALAHARLAVSRLGDFAGDVEGGVESLACDRLELALARTVAANHRVAPTAAASTAEPHVTANSRTEGLVLVDRFDRLFQVVLSHARDNGSRTITLDAVCAATAAHVGVTSVAITCPTAAGGAQTLGAYGDLARQLEDLQATLGDGPSLDALAAEAPIHLECLHTDQDAQNRWPEFAPAALAAGLESLYALPMRVGAAHFGVLALYLERVEGIGPGPLGPAELDDAIVLAEIALGLLLNHIGLLSPDAEGAGSSSEERRFFDDRPEIHQATGMISVQLGVDLGTALLRIRPRAYAEGRQLSDLAPDVVARKIRFTPDSERAPR